MRTGASSSGGKGLTAVSTATWVRFPATADFTCGLQRPGANTWSSVWTPTWLVCALDVRVPMYGLYRPVGRRPVDEWQETWVIKKKKKKKKPLDCPLHP